MGEYTAPGPRVTAFLAFDRFSVWRERLKKSRKTEKREPVHRLPLSWRRSRHAKAARDFRPLIPPASQATTKISLWVTGGHSNRLRLTLRKQHALLWPDVTSLLNIQKGLISRHFRINHLKSRGGRVDCVRLSSGRDTCLEIAPLSDRFRLYNVGSLMTRHHLKITWKWCNAKKLVGSQFTIILVLRSPPGDHPTKLYTGRLRPKLPPLTPGRFFFTFGGTKKVCWTL